MTFMRLASAAALAGAVLALPVHDAAAQPARPTVNITLASHYYAPSPIHLAGGVPVRLVFTNRAGKDHDFHAEQFFRSARILSGHVMDGEVHLHARQTAVVDLIPARGTYNVHCTEPFHKLLGMKTKIIVS